MGLVDMRREDFGVLKILVINITSIFIFLKPFLYPYPLYKHFYN